MGCFSALTDCARREFLVFSCVFDTWCYRLLVLVTSCTFLFVFGVWLDCVLCIVKWIVVAASFDNVCCSACHLYLRVLCLVCFRVLLLSICVCVRFLCSKSEAY